MKPKLHNLKKAVCYAALLAVLSTETGFAQTPTIRSYATRQGTTLSGIDLLGSATALANAVDADPLTASNLTIGIGITATRTQILDFNPDPASTSSYATTIAANTPITVKFSLPAGLVAALNNLEIQAVTDLHKNGLGAWVYTAVGPTYTGGALAGLLSGAGSQEFTLTPASAYQGVRISITGLASVAAGIDIYDAYIKVPAPGNVACSSIIDMLSGIRAGTVVGGIANATGGVTNAINLIDNTTGTFATLNTGAQVLSQVYETAVFNTPSKIGDTVRFTVQDVSSSLLNLGLLTGLTLNFYNGSNGAPVQTITNDPTLLSLNLLNPVGNIMSLTVVPNAVFDRVELQLGGVTGALQSLRVYDVSRINAGVDLTNTQKDIYLYAGNSFDLVASCIASGDTATFFDAATNGNIISSHTIATTTAQGDTVLRYFACAMRHGCTENADREEIDAHVAAYSRNAPANGDVGVPYNSSVAVVPQSPGMFPVTPAYNYSTSSTLPPGVTLNSSTGALTGTPTFAGSYPTTVTVTDVANNKPVGTFNDNIVINNTPLAVNLVSFGCEAGENYVMLNWKTALETNNKGFEIERSADGKSFSSIGYVKSHAKDGAYTFTDESPLEGLNQYRLKIIDNNDNYTYSRTISAKVTATRSVSIYPNPADGNVLYVKGSDVKNITVSNTAGQTVNVPVNYSNAIKEVLIQSLSKGIYYLNVSTTDGKTAVHQFIIR